MKNLIVIIICSFIFCLILLSGCEQITQPTPETSGSSLKKALETRPFSGTLIYTLSVQVNDSVQIYNASGTATHWGNCSVLDTTTHHYTQTGLTVVGSDWVTTASGAIVHMTWFMDYYDPTTWVWEIVGGTGRFEGATGGGTYTAGFTSTGDLWVKFIGTITY